MAEATPQRAWRALCPNCGAPVEFRSAASTSAVCSFCRSTLARDGETLKRIGQSAELFDDHSPLQLGAAGRAQGVNFTLVGRLQHAYADGTWNEWYVWFDNGRTAWLSEDNGSYVLSFDAELGQAPPELGALRVGQRVEIAGQAWQVASVASARLLAAQGELPKAPRAGGEFAVVDLRNNLGEVATLDFSDPQRPAWSVGRTASLSELAMTGLRETSEKTLGARSLNCPSCGAGVDIRLASTQSVACGQCHAVVDVSRGDGGALRQALQAQQGRAGRGPRIPVGRTGRMAIGSDEQLDWQCVGYLERQDIPEEDGESPTPWSEYLLYHRTAGFAFLVDGDEGWSGVRPLTGAPEVQGRRASWQGQRYDETYRYAAVVTWVEGEFYWRVRRDERADVTDYAGQGAASGRVLSRESTGHEVTWSGGKKIDATQVAAAFGLGAADLSGGSSDTLPLSTSPARQGLSLKTALIVFALIVLLVLLMSRCSSDRCDEVAQTFGANSVEYRQCVQTRSSGSGSSGGSYGGYSSGGGHK